MNVALHRGSKAKLEELNKIYAEFEVIVELEPEDEGKSRDELLGVMRRYKIGDGIHTYKELDYQEGRIPVAFVASTKNYRF